MKRAAWGCVVALAFVVAGCSGGEMDVSTVPAGGGETDITSSSEAGNDAGCLFGGCDAELEEGTESATDPADAPSDASPNDPPEKAEQKPLKIVVKKDGDLGKCPVDDDACQKMIKATGGSGKYEWSAEGLPAWMALDDEDGKKTAHLTVKNAPVGIWNFTVTVRDVEDPSQSDTQEFRITVTEEIVLRARHCKDEAVLFESDSVSIPWAAELCFEVIGGKDKDYAWEVACSVPGVEDSKGCDALGIAVVQGEPGQRVVEKKSFDTPISATITVRNAAGDEAKLSFSSLTFESDPCEKPVTVGMTVNGKTMEGEGVHYYQTSFGKPVTIQYTAPEGLGTYTWDEKWTATSHSTGVFSVWAALWSGGIALAKGEDGTTSTITGNTSDVSFFPPLVLDAGLTWKVEMNVSRKECPGEETAAPTGAVVISNPVHMSVDPQGVLDGSPSSMFTFASELRLKELQPVSDSASKDHMGYIRLELWDSKRKTPSGGWKDRLNISAQETDDGSLVLDEGPYQGKYTFVSMAGEQLDITTLDRLRVHTDPEVSLWMDIESYTIDTTFWCGRAQGPGVRRKITDDDDWDLEIIWTPKVQASCDE